MGAHALHHPLDRFAHVRRARDAARLLPAELEAAS